jgi:hypothetical protein
MEVIERSDGVIRIIISSITGLHHIFNVYHRRGQEGRFVPRSLLSEEKELCKLDLTNLRDRLFQLTHGLGRRFVSHVCYSIQHTDEKDMGAEGTAFIKEE